MTGLSPHVRVGLGNLHWTVRAGPYANRLLCGAVLVENVSGATLTRVQVDLVSAPFAAVLTAGAHYVACLEPQDMIAVDFRVGSLSDQTELRVVVRFRDQSNGEGEAQEVLQVPGERPVSERSVLAFASYCAADMRLVRPVLGRLKALPIRIWQNYDTDRDGWFPHEIKRALRDAAIFVPLLSRAAVASPWVTGEVDLALEELEHGKLETVVPLVLEPCDIPPNLTHHSPVDVGEGAPAAWEEVTRRVLAICRRLGE